MTAPENTDHNVLNCPHCQTELFADARLCDGCGALRGVNARGLSVEQAQRRFAIWGGLFAVLFISPFIMAQVSSNETRVFTIFMLSFPAGFAALITLPNFLASFGEERWWR